MKRSASADLVAAEARPRSKNSILLLRPSILGCRGAKKSLTKDLARDNECAIQHALLLRGGEVVQVHVFAFTQVNPSSFGKSVTWDTQIEARIWIAVKAWGSCRSTMALAGEKTVDDVTSCYRKDQHVLRKPCACFIAIEALMPPYLTRNRHTSAQWECAMAARRCASLCCRSKTASRNGSSSADSESS